MGASSITILMAIMADPDQFLAGGRDSPQNGEGVAVIHDSDQPGSRG